MTLLSILAAVVLVVVAATFFELGRASQRRELEASWHKARCGECGAEPRPRILHVSGCESGWPDPAKLFDGGR